MRNYKHKSRKRGTFSQKKPNDLLRQQVRQIGCDHFGIVVVDSSKKNFCVKMSNFWGDPLWGPEDIPNTKGHLENLENTLNSFLPEHGLKDLVIGIEQTGRLHLPIKNVLGKRWPVKIIHPFTTKQLRQPFSLGTKTDAIDLDAMTRAMIGGYGSVEPPIPLAYRNWQCVNRVREDLVKKRSAIKCQCQERIQALMPGYCRLFSDFWTNETAVVLVEEFNSASHLLKMDVETLYKRLHKRGVRCKRKTLHRIKAWALDASPSGATASVEHRVLCDYLEIIRDLTQRIDEYEKILLDYLVQTPGILLLSIAGINVVSSSGYTSELGPIGNYPGPSHINGRAGLYPSCYQSDEVCRSDGPMVGGSNARLRDAILEIVHNLINHNGHFHAWSELREQRNWPTKKIRIAIANRFSRISYHMLAGNEVFNHPSSKGCEAILSKMIRFAADHNIPASRTMELIETVVWRLPYDALKYEEDALRSGAWRATMTSRHYGLKRTSSIKQIKDYMPKILDTFKKIFQQRKGDEKNDSISLGTS
jgi:transposase